MTPDQAVAFKTVMETWDKMRVDDASPYDLLAISPARTIRIGDCRERAPVSLAYRAARALGQLIALDAVDPQITPTHRGYIYDGVSVLGSRAVAYFEAGRRAKEQQLREDVRTHPVLLRAKRSDVFLAPFLSRGGLPLLINVSAGSHEAMIEVTAVDGWSYRLHEDGDVQYDRITSAADAGAIVQHYNVIWPEGVHLAPWWPHLEPNGGSWVVVDRDHCFFALVDFEDAADGRAARRDAEALLDAARLRYKPTGDVPRSPPPGYHDPYDDGHPDDDGGFGDQWKL